MRAGGIGQVGMVCQRRNRFKLRIAKGFGSCSGFVNQHHEILLIRVGLERAPFTLGERSFSPSFSIHNAIVTGFTENPAYILYFV